MRSRRTSSTLCLGTDSEQQISSEGMAKFCLELRIMLGPQLHLHLMKPEEQAKVDLLLTFDKKRQRIRKNPLVCKKQDLQVAERFEFNQNCAGCRNQIY